MRSKFRAVKDDPNDDIILRTAHDCRAKYVVSADRHLLSLGEFRGIKIVTANEMLEILSKKMNLR